MSRISKRYFQYVIPAVLSFALSGIYTIVDGYFIGNRMGDVGIAAITLGYPVTAFVQAMGTGIGLAGAIRYTILKARGQQEEAERCLGGTVLLMLLGCALVMGLVLWGLYPLLALLGAKGAVTEPAAEYVRCIVWGTVFQVLGTGLVPFIRNRGGAGFAMVTMFCGFVGNVLFDWLLVWHIPCGMAGAAWASVLGQAMTAIMALLWLWVKRAVFRLPEARQLPAFCGQILRVGAAPFGLVLSPNITLLLMNRFLLLYGDEQALAVYGCIGYVACIVQLLLQGVGDGCQPLISRFYGQGDQKSMLHTRRLAYYTSFLVAGAYMLAAFLTGDHIGSLFGTSAQTNGAVARILPWFLLAMPCEAYTSTGTAYLYATEKSTLSYLLVYAEPLLVLMLLCTLGPLLGLSGVWASNPLARLLAALLAGMVKLWDDRRSLKPEGEAENG